MRYDRKSAWEVSRGLYYWRVSSIIKSNTQGFSSARHGCVRFDDRALAATLVPEESTKLIEKGKMKRMWDPSDAFEVLILEPILKLPYVSGVLVMQDDELSILFEQSWTGLSVTDSQNILPNVQAFKYSLIEILVVSILMNTLKIVNTVPIFLC